MSSTSMLSLAVDALRRPRELVDRGDTPAAFATVVPRLLAIACLGLFLFGAVVGSYRGGIQLLYAGVKMPLLLLIPLVVGLPAVHGILVAGEAAVPWRRLALAALVGLARGAVLAAAAGPLLWLVYSMGVDYHLAVLLLAGALVALMLPGLAVLVHALPRAGLRRLAAAAMALGIVGALTAQTGWLLRPFVARPTVEVAFLRPVEEDVFSSLAATGLSAAGVYRGWDAEASGAVGRWQERQRQRQEP